MDRTQDNGFAWRCAITIFLGAFLLFQVQPLISKMILPWFGGSPAVWTTCMLFFQFVLLFGYLYADCLNRVRRTGWQVAIHVGLLLLAVCLLPITRAESFKPIDSANPTVRILFLLGVSVGLPYLTVSTTGPLVQAWFARIYQTRSPYRLYALSNVGSLAALISYPVVVEPMLSVRTQGYVWSIAFVIFAVMNGWLVISVWRQGDRPIDESDQQQSDEDIKSNVENDDAPTGRLLRTATWILLPAFASMMLLAVTNQLCQSVAVIPFLWVAPLSLYLTSFIICFDNERWYDRRWFALGGVLSVLLVSNLLLAKHFKIRYPHLNTSLPFESIANNVVVQIVFYLLTLFCICMVCHGEVVRKRPSAKHLTRFYLAISFGGAMGGLFVSLVCPQLFSSFFEINLGLMAGFALAGSVFIRAVWRQWLTSGAIRVATCSLMVLAFGVVVWAQLLSFDPYWKVTSRNFYGVLTIEELFAATGDPDHGYMLYHGAAMHGSETAHGFQFLMPQRRREPTMYYLPNSGIGLLLRSLPREGQRVGIVGLGAGTIATYGRPGDEFRFYEINPIVERYANEYFTFLKDSPAETSVVLGDGRLALERSESQSFDVLILDAFSGDTVPTHLLTREAFKMYLEKHLKKNGVLAVHVSNRYLNLIPVVARLAQHFDLRCLLIRSQVQTGKLYHPPSDWLLLTPNPSFLNSTHLRDVSIDVTDEGDKSVLWTDQYNNLFQLLWQGRDESELHFHR